MGDLEKLVAELRDALAKATPGPWVFERRRFESVVIQDFKGADGYNNRIACCVQWSPAAMSKPTPDEAAGNANLIARARNNLPALLDALSAKDAEITSLRAEVERMRAEGFKAGMEHAAGIAEGERLEDEPDNEEDEAYNTAISHVVNAIRDASHD